MARSQSVTQQHGQRSLQDNLLYVDAGHAAAAVSGSVAEVFAIQN
jgi:hypothetical protein